MVEVVRVVSGDLNAQLPARPILSQLQPDEPQPIVLRVAARARRPCRTQSSEALPAPGPGSSPAAV